MDENLVIKKLSPNADISSLEINSLLDSGSKWNTGEGKKFLENPDNIFLIAFWDGKVAGFLTAHRLQRYDNKKAEILLYEIGVDKKYQQKGIGKALVEIIKSWGKEVGADEMWVLTNTSNVAANALYKSSGGIVKKPDDTIMYDFKL